MTTGGGAHNQQRLRGVIVDECPLYRHGVVSLLAERDVAVAGQCETAADGLGLLRTTTADLLVVGTPSGGPPAELVGRARAAVAGLRVVVLVPRMPVDDLRRLLGAVPDAVLTRNAGLHQVADAVERVRAGERVVDPVHLTTLIGSMAAAPGTPSPLTAREMAVLLHLADGRSNREIADELVVSVATVKTHLAHIYGKLGAVDRRGAVARGVELGLLV